MGKMERLDLQKKLHKWDNFRKQRTLIVDRYLYLRRKQLQTSQWLTLVKKQQIVKLLAKWVQFNKDRHARISMWMLIQLKSILSCKRLIRRYGGLTKRHLQYQRNALSSAAFIITPISQKLAKKPFLLALEKKKLFIDFKDKLAIMNSHIKRI